MKNEKSLDNFILLYIIIAYAVIFFLIIANFIPNFAAIINLLFIVVLTVVSYFIYGFQKNKVEGVKLKILKEVGLAIFVYFTFIYTLGLFTGYYQNPYSQSIIGMLKNSVVPLLTTITLELFRYMYMMKNKGFKGAIVFGALVMSLFDIVVAYYLFDLSLYEFFIFGTTIVLPLIFKNIVLSYITLKSGYQSCLIYVIPLALFKYFVPVVPALGDYLSCIVNISLPSLIYIYASRLYTNDLLDKELQRLQATGDKALIQQIEDKKKKKRVNVYKVFFIDMPIIFISSIIIVLISGIFNYHLIGVDTSAISPGISRGDAILIYKGYHKDQYNESDIVIYQSNDEYIVDRIAKKETNDDGQTLLYVKSEVTGEEVQYKQITDNILGVYVKFKIKGIAYPTIWFKEFINGGKK